MSDIEFQSSFELTGYITLASPFCEKNLVMVSKLFRAYGLYNLLEYHLFRLLELRFKALSSLRVI